VEQDAIRELGSFVTSLDGVVKRLGVAADRLEYALWAAGDPSITESLYEAAEQAQNHVREARQDAQHVVFGLRRLLFSEYLTGIETSSGAPE
jgi:hypothetical protein